MTSSKQLGSDRPMQDCGCLGGATCKVCGPKPAAEQSEVSAEPKKVTLQNLIDAGLNGFGLQLFIESIASKKDATEFQPITVNYKGILITMQPAPGEQIDTRHQ